MKLENRTFIEVEKDGKLAQLVVPNDMPLGLLFDAVMEMKGYIVERMAKVHKEEQEEAEEKMSDEPAPEKEEQKAE